MSESNMVRWGILSTAQINRAVIPQIKALDYTTLYGIASRDPHKAQAYAAEHGFEASYGGYQQLLDDPRVDAVYISLPNGMHYEWMVKALERGKHVLCEKSITTTVADVRAIKRLAEEKGLLVMEGFMYRYHPFFRKILEVAQSDLIGPIQNIQISRAARQSNPRDIRLQPGLGPGVMGDVGCYCLNFCRAVMGSEPSSWQSQVRTNEQGVDMEALIRLVFSPHQTAQIFCSFTTNGSFAAIIGAGGALHIAGPFATTAGTRDFLYLPDGGQTPERIEVVAEETGHALEIEDFSQAVLERRRPYLSLDDSIGNLTILQDVVENGQPL
jgi:D-xylose 1-dehydrogenase (NADP+, D-xylono-1,5-lactone-forming)